VPEAIAGLDRDADETEEGYVTAPGGFSADGPDRGSEILVALVPPLKGRVSRTSGPGGGTSAARSSPSRTEITHLDLIEADHDMLEAARANIDDPRAAFHWADVTRFDPGAVLRRDHRNPPFHTGRRADRASGGPSSRRRPAC
jgi:16S rRNA (guanine1207-N2)-methyltransferase